MSFFDIRYKIELILGDNSFALIRKSMGCRKKTQTFPNNDLKEFKFKYKNY